MILRLRTAKKYSIIQRFFINVGKNVSESVPASAVGNTLDYMSGSFVQSFCFFQRHLVKLNYQSCHLNMIKCYSVEKIPAGVLKFVFNLISHPLSIVFN